MIIGTLNGRTIMQVDDRYRPLPAQLHRNLAILDGEGYFAFLMYWVTDEAGWPDGRGCRDSDYDEEYIQSAGAADAMCVEVRRVEDDGQLHHYVVGRPGDDAADTDVEIKFGENTLRMRQSEVFGADEAAPIYLEYFQSRSIPGEYELRELDLS